MEIRLLALSDTYYIVHTHMARGIDTPNEMSYLVDNKESGTFDKNIIDERSTLKLPAFRVSTSILHRRAMHGIMYA